MIKLNGEQVTPTIFPDGTSQVWKLDIKLIHDIHNTITWEFQSESEFIHVAQLKDLIDRFSNYSPVTLNVPYMPYGRQDKLISNNSTFALQTFATLVNSLNFDTVKALDAHSDLSEYIIKSFINVKPTNYIKNTILECLPDEVILPDNGATRYKSMLPHISFIIGDKTRDQETGYITDYKIDGDVKDKNCLILDDICDGGMTFILLTKKLLEMGASSVNLYTTHGIYSKGLKPLKDAGIDRIFNYKGEVSEVGTYPKNIAYKEI